jgi:molybdopterin-guanine dinucleotide biosynthesis protein A
MSMVSMQEVTLLILAGGRGERFGGSKALYEVRGRPLLSYLVERVSSLSKRLIISVKSDPEIYSKLFPDAEIVVDEHEIYAPIVGLMSSLAEVKTDYVAVLPCDSPLVDPELIILLLRRARGRGGAVPIWEDGRIEPLLAVYKTDDLRKSILDCWNKSDLRVRCAIESMDIVYVSMDEIRGVDPELRSFLNINTQKELELLNELLGDPLPRASTQELP